MSFIDDKIEHLVEHCGQGRRCENGARRSTCKPCHQSTGCVWIGHHNSVSSVVNNETHAVSLSAVPLPVVPRSADRHCDQQPIFIDGNSRRRMRLDARLDRTVQESTGPQRIFAQALNLMSSINTNSDRTDAIRFAELHYRQRTSCLTAR